MRHFIILIAAMFSLALYAQETQDFTTRVKNTTAAWGATGTYKAGDINCMEYYSESHFYHGTFAQTVTGLPVGVYEAEVYFNASCAAWSCDEIVGNGTYGRTHLYINDAEVDVPVYNVKEITQPTLYTIKNIHVTDGTLYLGARNDREGANWHLIRMKSLKYLGTDVRSLYDAQFPMIRKARLALAASTCPAYQELLQSAISESLVASAYDSKERLQTLYDNITTAVKESENFETRKKSSLKNLVTRLDYFQRTWNNGTCTVVEGQWNVLVPAVEQACRAKDEDCDYEVMDAARQALNEAMTAATGIMPLSADPDSGSLPFTLDGRPATTRSRGIIIDRRKKILR